MAYANQGAVAGVNQNANTNLVGAVVGSGNGTVKPTAINKKALMKQFQENAENVREQIATDKSNAEKALKENYNEVIADAKEDLAKQKAEAIETQKSEVDKQFTEELNANKSAYNQVLQNKTELQNNYTDSINEIKTTVTNATKEITNESGDAWNTYKSDVETSLQKSIDEWKQGEYDTLNTSYSDKIETYTDKLENSITPVTTTSNLYANSSKYNTAGIRNNAINNIVSTVDSFTDKLKSGETLSDSELTVLSTLVNSNSSYLTSSIKSYYSSIYNYLTSWNSEIKEVNSVLEKGTSSYNSTLSNWLSDSKETYLKSYEDAMNDAIDETTKVYNESMNNINNTISEFQNYFANADSTKSEYLAKSINEISNAYDTALSDFTKEQQSLYESNLQTLSDQYDTSLQNTEESLNENYRNAMAYYGISLPKGASLRGKNVRAGKRVGKSVKAYGKVKYVRPKVVLKVKKFSLRGTRYGEKLRNRLGRIKKFSMKPCAVKMRAYRTRVPVRLTKDKLLRQKVRVKKSKFIILKNNKHTSKVVHSKTQGKTVYRPQVRMKVRPVKPVNARPLILKSTKRTVRR